MKSLRHYPRRGFALLLTLIIVSFAAAIAVLFLLSARQERAGTDSYAQGSRVRQLADTAVNLVIGQINTATREGTVWNATSGAANNVSPISWASQPGMIRTYYKDGTMAHAYKLYSWNNMIEAGAAFDPFNISSTNPEVPPIGAGGWTGLPVQYTDLNAPFTDGSGNQIYPIMDPSVANTVNTLGPTGTATQKSGAPVWDFLGEIAYVSDPTTPKNGYAVPTSGNVLPMPVQWLYILQDGTWVYPSTVNGSTATFTQTDGSGNPQVSATNPIVGRIAFWTDDETSKVNVNTAGEGVYWDWPKAATQDEMQFVGDPPGKNEFNRISGHPASTSFSAVFPDLMDTSGFTTASASQGFSRWDFFNTKPITTTALTGVNATFQKGLQRILGAPPPSGPSALTTGLTPRYTFGLAPFTGSQGGTYPAPFYQTYTPSQTSVSTGLFADGTTNYTPSSNYTPIVLNTARLYVTPDELFFPPSTRSTETTALNSMTAQALSKRLFFLTANSKAPETTIFNTPRVSVWPITWPYPSSFWLRAAPPIANYLRGAQPTTISLSNPSFAPDGTNGTLAALAGYTYLGNHNIAPQEDLIAFCSTLNTQATAPLAYYFQRQNPNSSTFDWTSIQRNRYLANYIRGEIHQKAPGFGDSLEDQWNNDSNNLGSGAGQVADYITLECMDYCRSMINQYTYDPNNAAGGIMYSFTGYAGAQAGFTVSGTTTGTQSPNERMALTATPLRIAPGSGTPNFTGTPPTNSSDTGAANKAAYVTQGAYPSLREVALEFIATQRRAPVYLGPTTVSGTTPIKVDDPFYWANLINVGTQYSGIGPIIPAATGVASDSALNAGTLVPDGNASGSYGSSSSQELEKNDMYPLGAQTTEMQGILLFNFAQLRDGINASPSPTFWIKVTGALSMTVNANNYFAQTITGEYRARSGPGTYDTVFQTLYGRKTYVDSSNSHFAAVGGAVQPNWPFCTSMIPVNSTDLKFAFVGAPITVSIYAENPETPDVDPTSNADGGASQFVTSYKVDFTHWAGPQPIPIAPRWNVRQARDVPYPNPFHVLATVTGTTYTPPAGLSGTTSWVSTEMVPDIANLNNYTWTPGGSPSPGDQTTTGTDRTFIRDIAAGFVSGTGAGGYPAILGGGADAANTQPLDNLGSSGSQWMMYACYYNNAAEATVNTSGTLLISGTTGDPSITGPFGWSMSMANRISSLSGTMVTAEGSPLGSGTTIPLSGAPLYTDTTFNSGGQGVPNYAPEAYTEITPYDTVMSAVIDPGSQNNKLQGDPRLTNALGEKVVFDSSQIVLNIPALRAALSPVVPKMVLNALPPPTMWSVPPNGYSKPASGTVTEGFRGFPRVNFQTQCHELGSPSSMSLMTGYEMLPMWGSSLLPNASTPSAGRAGHGFALAGNYGITAGLGASYSYASIIGLDTNAYNQLNPDWDWTSSPGNAFDGGYIERPDQDYQSFYTAGTFAQGLGTPYFNRTGNGTYAVTSTGAHAGTSANFVPNRQVPSPIIFGTLPSSLTQGWQTLAFAPNQAIDIDQNGSASSPVHPGLASIVAPSTRSTQANATTSPYSITGNIGVPDHLLLDLFWMPVAEPYPISEQFATAGKINLNYAMMPFPYIVRKSGLDAVLKSVYIYAVPDTGVGNLSGQNVAQDYKSWFNMSVYAPASLPASGINAVGHGESNPSGSLNSRFPINVEQTLKGFDDKFSNGDIFRSASQICDMFLYPNDPYTADTPDQGVVWQEGDGNMRTWWNTYGRLTSDNGREAPYNAIYSRITTQSNTYTVHWKVQSLHKVTANGSQPNTWTEGFDRIASELRGSTLIERYIDPNAGTTTANSIPDYADPINGPAVSPITYYYKWRVDNETYFQPSP